MAKQTKEELNEKLDTLKGFIEEGKTKSFCCSSEGLDVSAAVLQSLWAKLITRDKVIYEFASAKLKNEFVKVGANGGITIAKSRIPGTNIGDTYKVSQSKDGKITLTKV